MILKPLKPKTIIFFDSFFLSSIFDSITRQEFFYHVDKTNMSGDDMQKMDQCCKIVFAIGVIILVYLLWNDFLQHKSSTHRHTNNTCGMRSNIDTTASAKRSYANGRSTQRDDAAHSPPPSAIDYIALNERWPYSDTKEPMGTQNSQILNHSFSWEVPCNGDTDVKTKFDQVAIDKNKVKANASIRAVGPNTATENPKYTRATGMVNPVHELYRRTTCKPTTKAVYNPNQVPLFNESEAHHQAKMSNQEIRVSA